MPGSFRNSRAITSSATLLCTTTNSRCLLKCGEFPAWLFGDTGESAGSLPSPPNAPRFGICVPRPCRSARVFMPESEKPPSPPLRLFASPPSAA
eukprot:362772-Chlamydomonas_euryale.AAC.8